MTRQLYPGDIIKRNSDGQHWILIDHTDYGKDILTMNFFIVERCEMIRYTSPWNSRMPSPQFTVL